MNQQENHPDEEETSQKQFSLLSEMLNVRVYVSPCNSHRNFQVCRRNGLNRTDIVSLVQTDLPAGRWHYRVMLSRSTTDAGHQALTFINVDS
jgi:hypothetical protein